MKFLSTKGLAICVMASIGASPVLAESPFDGTWKGQIGSMKIQSKPSSWMLSGGNFSCKTCIPPYTVKADGKFQSVKGKPYWDDVAITVVDDHNVKFDYRKAGKVIASSGYTVSADGNSLTMKARNINNKAGVPVESTTTETRAGSPIAGAHLLSGEWNVAPASSVSDSGMIVTLKIDQGMLHLTSPMGETLHAKVGGGYSENVGDPGKTMTKAEMPGPRVLKLTDMRQGKVVNVSTYTVSADGTTIDGTFSDPRDGSRGTFVAKKQ